MTPETIARCVSELSDAYQGAERAQEGTLTCVRLPQVVFPKGCQPPTTSALVMLDQNQPKPRLLVRQKPNTPGGVVPRNVNAEIVMGEAWFGFSYNVAWEEGRHTAPQLVESSLRRFAKNE